MPFKPRDIKLPNYGLFAYRARAVVRARGEQIAANRANITAAKCAHKPGEIELSAEVHSASNDGYYRVKMDFSDATGTFKDATCNCLAAHRYEGPCKHMIALAKTFDTDPASFEGYAGLTRSVTSEALMSLMQRSEAARTERTYHEEVELVPTVMFDNGSWYVRFRVSVGAVSYSVKDIVELLGWVDSQELHSYGKKLQFVHRPDAFTPRSQAILSFLRDALRPSRRGAYYSRGARELVIGDFDVVKLFDAIIPATVQGEDLAYGRHWAGDLHIVEGDPELRMSVQELDGGYVLATDQDVRVVAGDSSLYLLMGNTLYKASPARQAFAGLLSMVYSNRTRELYVAPQDAPRFAASVLPQLEECFSLVVPEDLEKLKPVPCKIEFYFDRDGELVLGVPRAVYGTLSYNLLDAEPDKPGPVRDRALEGRAVETFTSYFGPQGVLSLTNDESAGRAVYEGVPACAAIGEVFTTPAFDAIASRTKSKPQIGLSIAGDLLKFSVDSEGMSPEEVAELLASYRRKKRYHRLRSGRLVRMEDQDLGELAQVTEDLDISEAELRDGVVELPVYSAFYLESELEEADKDVSFTDYVRAMDGSEAVDHPLGERLGSILRGYQKDGYAWLNALIDRGFGGILADEMGLGKTLQLISVLSARAADARETGPSLIVCPASLVYNWVSEFARFAPELEVRAVEGSKAQRTAILGEPGVDVFVVSYDIARRDVERLRQTEFWLVALDEAQYIKNHTTLTAKALKRLEARHRVALTGTPIENRVSEVWSIFDFLMPGFLGSYARFRTNFEAPILGGDEDAARRLAALIGPFILRRLKRDVLRDLPDKLENVLYVPLHAKQRKLYAAHEANLRRTLATDAKAAPRDRGQSRLQVLAELTRLRQIALDPSLLYEDVKGASAKTEAIMELVEEVRSSGQKTLVFSQFTSYLDILAKELEKAGLAYYMITGATPKADRLAMVNAFNGDDTPVFLVSLKAGGTGLNLTGASVVIHADPWWNAAATNQATDRAHRIGQTRDVNVYKVIAKDTVEERILALQEAKTELADSVVGGADGMSLGSLTPERLLDLLEG